MTDYEVRHLKSGKSKYAEEDDKVIKLRIASKSIYHADNDEVLNGHKEYNSVIDEWQEITVKRYKILLAIELAYGSMTSGLIVFMGNERSKVWKSLVEDGLVDGEDRSRLAKFAKDYDIL